MNMKRTGFSRKESYGHSEHPQAKEGRALKTCAHCGKPFLPFQSLQKVCATTRCAKGYATAQRKAKEAAERASDKARKEALKSITELEHECKDIVQKIARIRDRDDGCISCHMGANYGGRWHGSHFRPAGNNAAVQFHLWNIHKACAQCNLFKGGNIAAYRPRLVEKIGEARVAWLESQNQAVRYSREYLMRFKKVMGKRLRRMEKKTK